MTHSITLSSILIFHADVLKDLCSRISMAKRNHWPCTEQTALLLGLNVYCGHSQKKGKLCWLRYSLNIKLWKPFPNIFSCVKRAQSFSRTLWYQITWYFWTVFICILVWIFLFKVNCFKCHSLMGSLHKEVRR